MWTSSIHIKMRRRDQNMILSPNHAESMALKLDSRAVGEAQELLPFLESASDDAQILLHARGKEMVRTKQRIYNCARGSGWYRVLQSSLSKLSAGTEVRVRVLWKPAWPSLGACSVVPLRPQSNQILSSRSEVLHATLEESIMKSWSSSQADSPRGRKYTPFVDLRPK
jgi:hypothetical protein